MGDHYIPQYYLSGFSSLNEPSKIWVYEKGSERKYLSTLKNVANENKRWPKEVEKYLANQIETPAKPILQKIRNKKPITRDDKDVLATYIVVMLERVPEGLKRTKEIFPEVKETVFSNVEKDINRLIEENPSKKDILQKHLRELPGLKAKYENEFPKELWYKRISSDALPQVRAVLPTMTWIFLTSGRGQPFLTNDNPVFFFKWLGIGKPESEITFPISSEITLWITWRKNVIDNQYVATKETIVREINRRTAYFATRFVYGSTEANWVINLVNKKGLRLNSIK
jgi:hypothetical protein